MARCGDYDLRVESQAGEAYILAMACENFGAYWDETSIDFEKKIVEIHQPDGKNDLLQQVENGALTIVAGWKALGRLYRGFCVLPYASMHTWVMRRPIQTMSVGLPTTAGCLRRTTLVGNFRWLPGWQVFHVS